MENIWTRKKRVEGERGEVMTGEWRKMYSGELRKSYCSLYIVRVTKSRSVRLVGYAAHVGRFDMQTFNRSG